MEIIETTREKAIYTTEKVPNFTAHHPIYGTITRDVKEELEEILDILSRIKTEWVEIEIPKETLISIREMDLGITYKEYVKVKYIIHPYSWLADRSTSKIPHFHCNYYNEDNSDFRVVIQQITALGKEGLVEEFAEDQFFKSEKVITRLKY